MSLIPRRELDFLLFDWLGLDRRSTPHAAHLDRAAMEAVLDAAERLAREHFLPHAARADAEEPRVVDGRVRLIPEIGAALAACRDAGFFALESGLEDDGLQLPLALAGAIGAQLSAANVTTWAYVFLTVAAANLIAAHADAEQRALFLPPLRRGEWFGTMCLSEPHAGSSVGDIRTVAEPRPDGSYALRGTKMWISGGEHELADNIVHLVLAKIPGGPPGTRGISLFIVPRRRAPAPGLAGLRDLTRTAPADWIDNGVSLVGLNHKLGYRGTVNCLLNFGEAAPCTGWLIGSPHQGMAQMFHMMNEARIGVGIGAAALGVAGYQVALAYARERRQGRPPGADPAAPMVPLTAHADVRRMLLAAKAQAEGALALALYAADLADIAQHGSGPAQAEAHALLDLLTPVVKAWPAEHALAANDLAIQVLGGAGYTRDFPAERLWRDNRLNAIHEGTNGIQALDLLGRKLLRDGGRALALLATRIGACTAACRGDDALAPVAAAVDALLADVAAAVRALGAAAAGGDTPLALANAHPFLDAFGHLVVAWLLLDQGRCARARLDGAPPAGERAYLAGKLATLRWFAAWRLPRVRADLVAVTALERSVLDADPDTL